MGKHIKRGVRFGALKAQQATTKTVNTSDRATKVTKPKLGKNGKERVRKSTLKRSPEKKQTIIPHVPRIHLPKEASIQAKAKDKYTLTQAQQEKRVADRKRHALRVKRRETEEKKNKKTNFRQTESYFSKKSSIGWWIKKSPT